MRGKVGDGSVEARRREVVKEIRMVVAQMLRRELDIVGARGRGSKGEQERSKECDDHRDSSFSARSIHSRRTGMSSRPYRSVK